MVDLSIIITYYKTYELTEKLLDVLLPQLNDKVEIIFVDDGCNETRFDKYNDKMNIIHLEENKGGAFASNVGIDKAKGKYIAFVDSDDMVVENYIDVLLKFIESRNEEVIFMDWKDMHSGEIVRKPDNYAQWKAIYKKEIIPRFPEDKRYNYDVPFYDEINEKGYTRYYIDIVLYIYNSNREGSLTVEQEKLKQEGKI